MKKKSYRSFEKPTNAQIVEGMNVAEENAFRLLQDAEILFKARRYPSANSIISLALEEIGKVDCLLSMSLANSESGLFECWGNYYSHKRKAGLFITKIASFTHANYPDKPLFKIDEIPTYSNSFDLRKQRSIYSDYLGDGNWWNPSEIEEAEAKRLIYIARGLINNIKHKEKEIDIFIKYMGPIWGTNKGFDDKTKKELQAELKAEGIYSGVIIPFDEDTSKNSL